MLPLFLVVVPSQELQLPLPVYWKLWNISTMLESCKSESYKQKQKGNPSSLWWSQSRASITSKNHQEWIGNIHCFNQYHLFTSVFIHQDYLSVCLWLCLTLCQNPSSNFFCYNSYVCFLSHSCDPLEFL